MRILKVDNYIIDAPIITILYDIQRTITNGKLKDIKVNASDIVVTCPWHADGKEQCPDCNIYIGEDERIPYGFARCFACDNKGHFPVFVAACMDCSESFAKQWLIKKYGQLAASSIVLGDSICLTKKQQKPTLMLDFSQFQSYCPYLQKRKITREVCERFNIKYDPKRRVVIFPTYDEHGRLVTAPTRSIDFKQFHLEAGVEKPVYCLNDIIRNNISTVIIGEGPIDVLTAWSYGFPAIGTFGTISDYQIDKINRSCITTIYTMFDNDTAGKRFTEILKTKLNKRFIIKEVKIPNGRKDINDLSFEEFKTCIELAKNS